MLDFADEDEIDNDIWSDYEEEEEYEFEDWLENKLSDAQGSAMLFHSYLRYMRQLMTYFDRIQGNKIPQGFL
jgi:hypothetical protein